MKHLHLLSLCIIVISALLLGGCGAPIRQINPGDAVPIFRADHDWLQRQAAGHAGNKGFVLGMIRAETYGPGIYYSSRLVTTQAVAVTVHEGVGHLHAWRTGDASIWDTIDLLGSNTSVGQFVCFPVQSDEHPMKLGLLPSDASEEAQRAWAEYRARAAARTLEAKP
jgi:hypothetical protein